MRAIQVGLVAGFVLFNHHANAGNLGRESVRALNNRYIETARNAVPQSAPTARSVGALLAKADGARRVGNDLSALKLYDQILAIEPQNAVAREGRLIAISRLGSPDLALAEAARYPQVSPDVVQRLHEDEAALAIRLSEQAYHDRPIDNRRDADIAIRIIERNLKRYPQSERSRFDYVRALSNRQRHRQAIAEYETLKKENRELAGHVHQAAGTSYLASQQPEAAAAAFKAALAVDPNDSNASIGLFYALTDMGEFTAARTHIDKLAARPLNPEQRFEAETLAVWARAFEDRLGLAQTQFSALQLRAPASSSLHNALGTVYLWRGWPRKAEQEFLLTAQQDHEDLAAQIGLVDTAIALGDYRVSAERIAALSAAAPEEHLGIKKLARAQTIRDLHEFSFAIGSSRTKDRSTRGQSLNIDARLYSRPIGVQHRLFTHEYYETARFDQGKAAYQRAGLGWETIIPRRAKFEGEIQQEFFGRNRASAIIDGVFDFNDYWRVKARFDSNSIDVPLRARMDDVQGRSSRLSAHYRANERAGVEAGTQQLTMSDTNTRRGTFMAGHLQFVQGPLYKATLGVDVGTSTNTLESAAYFNPRRDRTVQATLANEWLGYRRYARAFYQRVFLSAGSYAQENYPRGSIGALRYEHDWSLSDVTNVRYGVGYVRRVFDGTPSEGPEAALNMSWRF